MFEHDDEETQPDLEIRLMMEELAADRRISLRSAVELGVAVSGANGIFTGLVENLSLGGAFVASSEILPVGAVLELCISVPELDRCIVASGEVRWRRPSEEASDASAGMGVRFLDLGPEPREAIEALLGRRHPLFFDD
jgi:uncharacterized protein (TIGR02266 family)